MEKWKYEEKKKNRWIQNFCKTSGIPSGYVTRGKWSRTLPITIIRVRGGFSILLFLDEIYYGGCGIGDAFEYS